MKKKKKTNHNKNSNAYSKKQCNNMKSDKIRMLLEKCEKPINQDVYDRSDK